MKRLAVRILTLLLASAVTITNLLATSYAVQAAGITVTTTRDENGTEAKSEGCSLREAIIAANTNKAYGGCSAGSGADNIFLPAGDYKLTLLGSDEKGGDLDITEGVAISGSGLTTFIHGTTGFGDRIFHVKSPAGGPAIQVTLSSLRISGGSVSSHPGGGGILNERGNLTLSRVWVDSNTVSSSTFGGGVTNLSGSTLTVSMSTFDSNSGGYGGAIYNGGILYLSNSLLIANLASQGGGGLDNNPADKVNEFAQITNTTITQNTSRNSGAGIASSGIMKVLNATIADNIGAGLWLYGGDLVIQNSILTRHKIKGNCVIGTGFNGTFTSGGYNLIDDLNSVSPCPFIEGLDIVQSANLTDDVQPNGSSPTAMYGFKNNESPAIDAIPEEALCPGIDQGLYGRPADGNKNDDIEIYRCDIGAFELNGTMLYTFLPTMHR
jgi:CSLREA domain-containing protein